MRSLRVTDEQNRILWKGDSVNRSSTQLSTKSEILDNYSWQGYLPNTKPQRVARGENMFDKRRELGNE